MACPRRKLGVGGWPRHRDGDRDARGSAMSCRVRMEHVEMEMEVMYNSRVCAGKNDICRE
jgi:hypothetical protein